MMYAPDTHPGKFAWQDFAECNGLDVETFFPEGADEVSRRYARALCSLCPVRAECLEVGQDFEYGIFGGMTPLERRRNR